MRTLQATLRLKTNLTEDEKKLLRAVEYLAGEASVSAGVNELSVVYSCPGMDVFAVLRSLVSCGLLERTAAGGVRTANSSSANCVPAFGVEIAEPPPTAKATRKRRYFSRLIPRKNLKRQIA